MKYLVLVVPCGNVEIRFRNAKTLVNFIHSRHWKTCEKPIVGRGCGKFSTVSTGGIATTLWKLLKTLF
ncbi:MAG TPA: hypothetical protein PKM58_00835, partial [Pyrinomonadaceae bacterium]|nr:hypothetical protein [Pyrinomonadaceae bacterium]